MAAAETSTGRIELGDLVIVSGHHVGEPQRLGEILEVLDSGGHEHYRVRWEDGHESVFFPGADAVIRPARQREKPANTPAAPKSLLERLDAAGIPYELIPHSRTTSAGAEAEALGVAPWQVAKTIVLTSSKGIVRAVLPASERLDLHKVRHALDDQEVELLTEEALGEAYPEFEVGAVPPTADWHGDRVLIDLKLCGVDFVYLEAGTHAASLKIGTADLIELADAGLADLCQS